MQHRSNPWLHAHAHPLPAERNMQCTMCGCTTCYARSMTRAIRRAQAPRQAGSCAAAPPSLGGPAGTANTHLMAPPSKSSAEPRTSCTSRNKWVYGSVMRPRQAAYTAILMAQHGTQTCMTVRVYIIIGGRLPPHLFQLSLPGRKCQRGYPGPERPCRRCRGKGASRGASAQQSPALAVRAPMGCAENEIVPLASGDICSTSR
jgi:hypothetical protein